MEINLDMLLKAKEEIIKKYMFEEELKEMDEKINKEIEDILTSFDDNNEEPIDE